MVPAILRENWRTSLPDLWLFLLKFCASITLASRGWLTWQADSPIRGLFWQEDWWSPLMENPDGLSWEEWARQSDPIITTTLTCIGVVLLAIALIPWLLSRLPQLRWLLWIGFFLLVIDSFARWVGSDYEFGMAIEHALQMISPLALFFLAPNRKGKPSSKTETVWVLVLLAATAFTFVGHGFYAMGIHPVPLSYQTMTMKLLGCGEATALSFLRYIGALDFTFALVLFSRPARVVGLYWCISWGFLTALARVVSHVDVQAGGWNLDPWFFETAVRTSHWLLPMLVLGMLQSRNVDTLREMREG